MKLGILAHTFGKQPTAQLAQTIADNGFNSVQLALASIIRCGLIEWQAEPRASE